MVDEFACPHCRRNLGSSMEPPGTTLMCPYCKQFFTIAADPESPPPPPSEPEPADLESADLESTQEDSASAESTPEVPPTPMSLPPPKITSKPTPSRESLPYIIPDLPRDSLATTVGYLGILCSVLGLLMALAGAGILFLIKLKPEFVADLPFLPDVLDLNHPRLFTYGTIAASLLGGYSLVGLIAGIGVLKEKRWARILLGLLALLAVPVLIALAGYIINPDIINYIKPSPAPEQTEPNITTVLFNF